MEGVQELLVGNEVAVCAAVGLISVMCLASLLSGKGKMARDAHDYKSVTSTTRILGNEDSVLQKDDVKKSVNDYFNLFRGARSDVGEISNEESVKHRESEYQLMLVNFYDLVTDFYEWGWGQSFHFAPRWMNESFLESIKRAEYHLCNMLDMKPGSRAIDVGCGVGGPMRNMAVFSGATIDGVTINEYQVRVGNKYNERMGLADRCKIYQGDFQKLDQNPNFTPGSYDAAYAIEATCHSPDKTATFKQVASCLRQGGLFAGYEWVMINNFDANNKDHVRVKEGIEVGNGLPTLFMPEVVSNCLEEAGFEVLMCYDANRGVHDANQIPWYATLNGSFTLSGFRMTYVGRLCTHTMVSVLEFLRIAPAGSTKVSAMLNATALDLVEGGKEEIFTPSYFFLARKK